jgi:2-polyprenyl-3-methyl-5-hydroxy-6-metoxy-1,4-benzoquinol methylase
VLTGVHHSGPPRNLTAVYETVPCNLCNSTEYRVVYPAVEPSTTDVVVEFRSSGDEPLRDRLVACTNCGLQFVSPRLHRDVILAGYREGSDEIFVSQAAARERTFERALAFIERLVPERGRLLDVGTAAGSFLHVAAGRGWTVAGCEPNRWLCDWGKKTYGLTIQPGTLIDQRHPDRAFDVVTVWDVLEHDSDPQTLLRECCRILKPGGLIVVNCPDIGSWIARVMGRRWLMLVSTHLYYFTRQTLRELLQKTGFEVMQMRPHIQWLELEYILKRSEPVAGPLSRAAARLASGLGLGHWQVPYWLGQTLVVARKTGSDPITKT